MKPLRPHLPFLAAFTVFLVLFFWWLNDGLLGHDYYYYFPKLLDGKWHMLRRGLAPFYYTAHFCGGFVNYGNPQSMLYSLQQILTLFLDVWVAVQLTMAVSIIAGYVGWYFFGRDYIKLKSAYAHLLALIISAHGFHFMHMIPGHVPFHSMPLIGWMLWMLLDTKRRSKKELFIKAAWFALVSGYILYSGGYMVFVMLLFALLAFVPIDFCIRSNPLKRVQMLIINGVVCGIGSLLICASKLTAVFSFLRYFPRELPFERLFDETNVLIYVVRALFAIPQTNSLFTEFGMPDTGAVHEYSLLVSPVVLIGLAVGLYLIFKKRSMIVRHPIRAVLIFVIAIVQLLFFAQLARGFGPLVTPLESLPIFSGLHVNMRYLYAYSFLLIAASCFCMQCVCKEYVYAFAGCILTVFAFFIGYKGLLQTDSLPRIMDYNATNNALAQFPNYLEDDVDTMMLMGDTIPASFLPLVQKSNVIDCMEPMLLGSSSLPDSVVIGPIRTVQDDFYNIYNPSCMIYAEENDCHPGDRISSDDTENLELFLGGEKTTWKVSVIQKISNILSLFMLIACLGISVYMWIYKPTPNTT